MLGGRLSGRSVGSDQVGCAPLSPMVLAGELVRNAVFVLRLTLLAAVRAATWCESANLDGELIIARYAHRHARSTL